MPTLSPAPPDMAASLCTRRLLHVGCGPIAARRQCAVFEATNWRETRLDINPAMRPDIVCSIEDMRAHVASGAFDALYSSHTIEHLEDQAALAALAEFHRVLSPAGFACVRCPDLEAVAAAIVRNGVDATVYESSAGPITPLDILYGHRRSVREGNGFMRHRTAFTAERLGEALVSAGFDEVRTLKAPGFELWALAFREQAAIVDVLAEFARAGLAFSP